MCRSEGSSEGPDGLGTSEGAKASAGSEGSANPGGTTGSERAAVLGYDCHFVDSASGAASLA